MALRMFHPSNHLWLRAVTQALTEASAPSFSSPSALASDADKKLMRVEIGLTQRGLEDVGDMTKVTFYDSIPIESGQPFLKIDWEGHTITNADELYHTMWKTYSDETTLCSPISGTVEYVNDFAANGTVDDTIYDDTIHDDTILASMITTEREWQDKIRTNVLVPEPVYLRLVKQGVPGRFSE